jgi:hypothetical protein
MSRLFFGLRSDLYGDTEFDGRLSSSHAGEVIMTKLEANRHRVRRETGRARQRGQHLKIIAPWQGNAAVEQHGRQSWVRPGGWAIYDTTGRYEVANPERSQHLIVMLPKDLLVERGLRLDPLMGRLVRRRERDARGAGGHAQHLPGTAAHERRRRAAPANWCSRWCACRCRNWPAARVRPRCWRPSRTAFATTSASTCVTRRCRSNNWPRH